nr:YidB family protein [uncultured Lichenicoccus sp.]
MSGIFGGLLGQLGGLLGGSSNAQAGAGGLLATVINDAGGPAGILAKFQQSGLGAQAESWVGSGHNLPITAEQVAQVFPPAQLDAWAQQHGLPAGVASQVLAHFLPHAVDATTPDGTTPPQGAPQPDASGIDFSSLIGRLGGLGK